MAELLKYVEDKLLSNKEYWSAGRGNEVIVSIEDEICSICVIDKNKYNISELISAFLKAKNVSHQLTSTIDSYMIEIECIYKDKVIELIDSEW